MKSLIFSTGNDSKFSTAHKVCDDYGIKLVQNELDIDEIQGEDPEKIVKDKVRKAYNQLKKPVVVSDDSWVIPGLNGFPGPYMKPMNHWFTVEDFLRLTLPLKDRRVFLIGYLAYKDGNHLKIFHQKREGFLLKEARGKQSYPNHKIFSMLGDNGLSISEVYDKGLDRSERDVAKIWHEFAEWFKGL